MELRLQKTLKKCFQEFTFSRTQVFEGHKAFGNSHEVIENKHQMSRSRET